MARSPLKNFRAYRVDAATMNELHQIEEDLDEGGLGDFAYHDPSEVQEHSVGLLPPAAAYDETSTNLLRHLALGQYLMCVQFGQRVIPGKVLKDAIRKAVEEKCAADGVHKLTREETLDIRAAVRIRLLPQAFVRHMPVYVLFCAPFHMFIFTASATRADEVMGFLREVLPTLKTCKLFSIAGEPVSLLTRLALTTHNVAGGGLLQGADGGVFEGDDGRLARIKDRDVYGPEVQNLLTSGYIATALRLAYYHNSQNLVRPDCLFTLTDSLLFRGLHVADTQVEDDFEGDQWAEFVAQTIPLAAECVRLVNVIEDTTNFDMPLSPPSGDDEL